MILSTLKLLASIIVIELFANFVFFPILNNVFGIKEDEEKIIMDNEREIDPRIKGTIERVCLTTALVLGFQSILIAFGALKIGTRLSPTKRHKVANDYFLVGNITSIFIALVEYFSWKSNLFSLGAYFT